MALQTSGQIAVQDLSTEFGGNAPHAMNEYYRGGGLVPDTGANSGIPTSGQVDLNDFYGGDSSAATLPGSLWLWGDNGGAKFPYGQLGIGVVSDATDKSSPVQTISGGTNWKKISMKNVQSSGVKTDGRLWMWGLNVNGELGINAAGQAGTAAYTKSSPVQTISGGTNWQMSSLGSTHSSGVKTDGRLWLWGEGMHGKLGDNSILSKSSPVQTISGGTNWKSNSLGSNQSSAIKTDGRLWMWGWNAQGQFGNNSNLHTSSPVQTISGGTNWQMSSMGATHASGVKTDGRLWLWGNNFSGQLGGNSVLPTSSPVQTISGGTNWQTSSLGGNHSSAIKT